MSRSVMDCLGHSANSLGVTESLVEHIREVYDYAKQFGDNLSLSSESKIASIFHDLGKMGIFQQVLGGKVAHIDHWSYGAYEVMKRWGAEGLFPAMAIMGHHTGLGRVRDIKTLTKLELTSSNSNLELSQPDPLEENAFFQLLTDYGVEIPESLEENPQNFPSASLMADIRMLYSILVDSDFLATEGHFRSTKKGIYYKRPKSPLLNPTQCYHCLENYLEQIRNNSTSSPQIQSIRNELWKYVLRAAENPVGNYTLSAPTGSGKTLAMLAFALKHAAKWNLERIIVVIPYLSILEQTAAVYRKALADIYNQNLESDAPFILEDHSHARNRDSGENGETEYIKSLAAENWDAPIVLTTNVQFFESLFSNRPGACRKLHRIARSVILFDEVQTLPISLTIATLATLNRLYSQFNSTLVMATATQPAFDHLNNDIKKISEKYWSPIEIVGLNEADPSKALQSMFDRSRRTKVDILNRESDGSINETSWEQIADLMLEKKRVLCIVNVKSHAQRLISILTEKLFSIEGEIPKEIYHLSTSMCPEHREKTLNTIREKLNHLEDSTRIFFITTQCVEAGVDIDFPVLFRAFGPLDSIAQAMGRCNRNQRWGMGEVYLFKPENPDGQVIYPSSSYQQATDKAVSIIQRDLRRKKLDLDSPNTFTKYYRGLYDLTGANSNIVERIKDQDFEAVSEAYRLIENTTVNVLVPYIREKYDALVQEVESEGLTRHWIRRARSQSVTVYLSALGKMENSGSLIRLPLTDRMGKASQNDFSTEWFRLLPSEENGEIEHPFYYDEIKGLSWRDDDTLIL